MLLFATCAAANPLCVAGSLSSYIASYSTADTGCLIGNTIFYNFGFDGGTGSNVQIGASASNAYTNPGLRISSGAFSISAGVTGAPKVYDANIWYSVMTLSGTAVLEDYSLLVAGSHDFPALPGSSIITETFSNGSTAPAMVVGYGPFNAVAATAHEQFTPWLSRIDVNTHILENVGPGDSVSISFIQESFSQTVPEPYGAVLIGSGLILLGMWRKRAS
jgi:hypothetical protein